MDMGGDGKGGVGNGRAWEWVGISKGKGGGFIHIYFFSHANYTTNIARIPPKHGQQYKFFNLPEPPDLNWRSVSLWTLSFLHTLIICTKAIVPILFLTLGHMFRQDNTPIVYFDMRYRYLLLKSKKNFRNHRKRNLVSFFMLFIKYLTSCQQKQEDHNNTPKTLFGLNGPIYAPLMDKLSGDLQKDRLRAFAMMHIRYRNHKSFIRFSLLLSGDVELNPGPIKNPCTICQGNVSIRGLFCKNCGIGCHKKCSPITCHTNYLCLQCQNADIPSVDSGNRIDIPLSNLNCIDERSDCGTDFTPNVAKQLEDLNHWKAFQCKGLHFLHINVNSLLPKIYEVNLIANKSNATILGISETKLDNTIMDSELKIEGYDLIRSDRNRHGGGVACYIKKDRHYNVRANCPTNFENIFLDLLLPNSKPILIGILYRPPDQSVFLDMVSSAIADMEDFDKHEAYLLGDFNFNLWDKSKYIFETSYSKTSLSWAKNYS